jgi:hypothetical protein
VRQHVDANRSTVSCCRQRAHAGIGSSVGFLEHKTMNKIHLLDSEVVRRAREPDPGTTRDAQRAAA